jgi:lysyl-tRNA synthetase class I
MKVPDLIPGQALIYERANGVVYARYRDPPYNEMYERWIIGGDADAVSRATGDMFSWSEWQDMIRLAETNHTLRTQMKKLLDIYYIVKDNK